MNSPNFKTKTGKTRMAVSHSIGTVPVKNSDNISAFGLMKRIEHRKSPQY